MQNLTPSPVELYYGNDNRDMLDENVRYFTVSYERQIDVYEKLYQDIVAADRLEGLTIICNANDHYCFTDFSINADVFIPDQLLWMRRHADTLETSSDWHPAQVEVDSDDESDGVFAIDGTSYRWLPGSLEDNMADSVFLVSCMAEYTSLGLNVNAQETFTECLFLLQKRQQVDPHADAVLLVFQNDKYGDKSFTNVGFFYRTEVYVDKEGKTRKHRGYDAMRKRITMIMQASNFIQSCFVDVSDSMKFVHFQSERRARLPLILYTRNSGAVFAFGNERDGFEGDALTIIKPYLVKDLTIFQRLEGIDQVPRCPPVFGYKMKNMVKMLYRFFRSDNKKIHRTAALILRLFRRVLIVDIYFQMMFETANKKRRLE